MKLPLSLAAIATFALVTPELYAAAPNKSHESSRISRAHGTQSVAHGRTTKDGDSDADAPKKHLKKVSARNVERAAKPCFHSKVAFQRGTEEDTFALTTCDGKVADGAIEHLSVLARPGGAAKPASMTLASARERVEPSAHGEHAGKGTHKADKKTEKTAHSEAALLSDLVAPGIKRLDPALVARLQSVADHFGKKADAVKIEIVSGYRPTSAGSFHASGKALDFRLDGVRNEELVAFCKTLPDAGCGYYPNSSFVHMDVRAPGSGHVAWIDASGPGEKPHYVSSWPPPASESDDAGQAGKSHEDDADVEAKVNESEVDTRSELEKLAKPKKGMTHVKASAALPALPSPGETRGMLVGEAPGDAEPHAKSDAKIEKADKADKASAPDKSDEPAVGEGDDVKPEATPKSKKHAKP